MSIDYAWEDLCPKYQYFGIIVLNLTTGHALGFHLTEKITDCWVCIRKFRALKMLLR